MNKIFINYFITKKRFILLTIIEVVLFALYYYIVSPSNFGSFSDTLRNYISALGTLLAVVVSFNTLALQNQLKKMPEDLSQVQDQIKSLENLLDPLMQVKERKSSHHENVYDGINRTRFTDKELDEDEMNVFQHALENITNALRSMIILARILSKKNLENKTNNDKEKGQNNEFSDICNSIFDECISALSLYSKTKHVYALIAISTTEFIQRLNFKTKIYNNEKSVALYEILKRLHVLKSIGYSIFIRNTLADLSKELLISSIPVITFIGLIASISNYENYPILTIRILFSISITVVTIPFIILFIRTIPILYLIKVSSTIPFSR